MMEGYVTPKVLVVGDAPRPTSRLNSEQVTDSLRGLMLSIWAGIGWHFARLAVRLQVCGLEHCECASGKVTQ